MVMAVTSFGESNVSWPIIEFCFWRHGMNMLVANRERVAGAYVPTSAIAKSLHFDDEMMNVALADGRIISVPIVWFPVLRNATKSERENYEISPAGIGIHWPDLDEDLSIAGLMSGVDLSAA
jgi:hypothetical protein